MRRSLKGTAGRQGADDSWRLGPSEGASLTCLVTDADQDLE